MAEHMERIRETMTEGVRAWNNDDVPSPCITKCVLDAETRICKGCGRHVDEISQWHRMTADEKQAVLLRVRERAACLAT